MRLCGNIGKNLARESEGKNSRMRAERQKAVIITAAVPQAFTAESKSHAGDNDELDLLRIRNRTRERGRGNAVSTCRQLALRGGDIVKLQPFARQTAGEKIAMTGALVKQRHQIYLVGKRRIESDDSLRFREKRGHRLLQFLPQLCGITLALLRIDSPQRRQTLLPERVLVKYLLSMSERQFPVSPASSASTQFGTRPKRASMRPVRPFSTR